MSEVLCACGHLALEHYRGECTMIDERIMLFCPCKRFRRPAAGPMRKDTVRPTPILTATEYEAMTDEWEQLAHQVGVLYARTRRLRQVNAPSIIIDHDQARLDRLADRLAELQRRLIDHDMAVDPDDDEDCPAASRPEGERDG